MNKILLTLLTFIFCIACSSNQIDDSYPKETTSEMYSLCLKTFRYGYCKCYVENWQKNISYEEYVVLKPQIDSGEIKDPQIKDFLNELHNECERLPTSTEGF